MARTICKIFGVVFLLAGVAGFAMPNLLGFHLTTIHNLIHIASGAAALYFGSLGGPGAVKTFCVVFGAGYLALGAVGFVVPGLVTSVIGHPPVSSGELMPDNVFHIVVGALFLYAGLTAPRAVPVGRTAV